jgi:hypothetical protein
MLAPDRAGERQACVARGVQPPLERRPIQHECAGQLALGEPVGRRSDVREHGSGRLGAARLDRREAHQSRARLGQQVVEVRGRVAM